MTLQARVSLFVVDSVALLSMACGSGSQRAPALPLLHEDREGMSHWRGPNGEECPFPAESDKHEIDAAVVKIRVLVGADGRPEAVQTLRDPGFGFGMAATECAMVREYVPGRDSLGRPVRDWTPPLELRFVR